MTKKKTQEEYIKEVSALFHGKYRYDKAIYSGWNCTLLVYCPVEGHGYFPVSANNHRHGCGCPKCHPKYKKTTEEARDIVKPIIERAGYKLVEPFIYTTGRMSKVNVFCPKHNYTWEEHFETISMKKRSHPFGPLSCKYCKGEYESIDKSEAIRRSRNYEYRTEFARGDKAAYLYALHNHITECFDHMKVKGSHWKRCIYAYFFKDVNGSNYVYVGLTYNIRRRDKDHRKPGSSVFKFCQKNYIEAPQPVALTEYLDKEEASKLETFYLKKYLAEGWKKINRSPTGGLGGGKNNEEFSLAQLRQIASNYANQTKWKNSKDRSSWHYAKTHYLMDDIFPPQRILHTFENCRSKAILCKSKNEFATKYNKYFQASKKYGWLEEFCKEFYVSNRHTEEELNNTLQECKNWDQFRKEHHNLWRWAMKHRNLIEYREIYLKRNQSVAI